MGKQQEDVIDSSLDKNELELLKKYDRAGYTSLIVFFFTIALYLLSLIGVAPLAVATPVLMKFIIKYGGKSREILKEKNKDQNPQLELLELLSKSQENEVMAKVSQLVLRDYKVEEEERKIAQILKNSFRHPETQVLSRLDDERLSVGKMGYLDIMLILPSLKTFAISVNTIDYTSSINIKVFFDSTTQTLKYRKGRDGKRRFHKDLIADTKARTQWLLHNRKGLFKHLPTEIIVFNDPVWVTLHPATPIKELEKKIYMKADGVFVVAAKDLVALIKALDRAKKKKFNQKGGEKPKYQGGQQKTSIPFCKEQKPQKPVS